MKNSPKLLLIINGLALLVAIVWRLISEPNWKTGISVLTLLATVFLVAERMAGQGGAGIRIDDSGNLHLDNQGVVRAGAGGSGSSGGDAIQITNGGNVTIINKGVIAGGNAGNMPSDYKERNLSREH